jgi:hypothetical protein
VAQGDVGLGGALEATRGWGGLGGARGDWRGSKSSPVKNMCAQVMASTLFYQIVS